MTFLGACTTRRLLNTRTWSPSRRFLSPTLGICSPTPSTPSSSQRNHTTIYNKLSRRPRASDSEDLVRFTNKLTYVLRRHSGRDNGLENRDDDYVSLQLLLNHPEFREMSMPSLQKIMDKDIKHRFELRFEPTNRDGCWWIRARKWNESYKYLKPLEMGKGPSQAVYRTTLKEWRAHISRNGIPRQHDEYIRLECSIPTDTYLDDLKSRDELFIFVDIGKCQRNGIRFFHPTPPPQPLAKPSHILTKGDEYGFISPDLFSEAARVLTKKQLLWGDADLTRNSGLPTAEAQSERPTFLKTPDWNLNGFVDFPYAYKRSQPQEIDEAKTIIATI